MQCNAVQVERCIVELLCFRIAGKVAFCSVPDCAEIAEAFREITGSEIQSIQTP